VANLFANANANKNERCEAPALFFGLSLPPSGIGEALPTVRQAIPLSPLISQSIIDQGFDVLPSKAGFVKKVYQFLY